MNKNYVVSIEGNIGVGKSTFLEYIYKHYNDIQINYEPLSLWCNYKNLNPLKEFYDDKYLNSFPFQLFTMKTLIDSRCCNKKKYIFNERSIQSSYYIFAKSLYEKSFINDFSYNLLEDLFIENVSKQGKIDLFVYLRTEPSTAYSRIQKRNRPEEKNITFEYISDLHEKHEDWLLKNKYDLKVPIYVINLDCEYNSNEYKNQIQYIFHNYFIDK